MAEGEEFEPAGMTAEEAARFQPGRYGDWFLDGSGVWLRRATPWWRRFLNWTTLFGEYELWENPRAAEILARLGHPPDPRTPPR